jgi:hypothetical protein
MKLEAFRWQCWVTSMSDPDGYRIEFESYTSVPEETAYSEE